MWKAYFHGTMIPLKISLISLESFRDHRYEVEVNTFTVPFIGPIQTVWLAVTDGAVEQTLAVAIALVMILHVTAIHVTSNL